MKRTFSIATALIFSATIFAQTSVRDEVPKGWHLLDRETTGFYGISTDKAYEFIKGKNLKSNTVIVAVIDSGVDTTHEDLKSVLWRNPREVAGNGIDDDKNGYVDDIYGWNFLGGRDGRNVETDSYESARVYHSLKKKWENVDLKTALLTKEQLDEYNTWKRAEKDVMGETKSSGFELLLLRRYYTLGIKNDSILRKAMGKDVYTGKELESWIPTASDAKKAKTSFLGLLQSFEEMESTNKEFLDGMGEYLDAEEKKADAGSTPPKDYRAAIVKDNYNDFNDRFYGNSDVMSSNKGAMHGTHVSGIIGAVRKNGVGADGVADNVKIMMLRAVPDGDEHDKDIALAIRYAVDNGAQVINMSFGKGFSPEKEWVDDAVRYAESKGVLLVHAAGNESRNIDSSFNYPSPVFKSNNKRANNWITVGASGDLLAGGLKANFSNYGKGEVDVFAPGVRIYSTIPGGTTYGILQGTSMASPVVAGLAALILEYYPELSAQQVKNVIEKSAQKPADKIKDPETGHPVTLADISKSGGIINAYEAVKLASTIKGERNLLARPGRSVIKPKVKQ